MKEKNETRAPMAVERFGCVPEMKMLDRERRQVRHLITSNSIDRAGDIVEPKGADLRSYAKNPVVLADHGHSIRDIIGTASEIKITDRNIESTTEFGSAGMGPEAFALVDARMARAWSIGFRAKDYHGVRDGVKGKCKVCRSRFEEAMSEAEQRGSDPETDGLYVRGLHFLEWEMLEYSLVAIPMNQDIVTNAIRRGLVEPAHVHRFFRPTDEWVSETVRRIYLPDPIGSVVDSDRTDKADDTLDTGQTPSSREDDGRGKQLAEQGTELYDALLGWGERLKRKNTADVIRAAARKLK